LAGGFGVEFDVVVQAQDGRGDWSPATQISVRGGDYASIC
jgi:hypothetical protein